MSTNHRNPPRRPVHALVARNFDRCVQGLACRAALELFVNAGRFSQYAQATVGCDLSAPVWIAALPARRLSLQLPADLNLLLQIVQ